MRGRRLQANCGPAFSSGPPGGSRSGPTRRDWLNRREIALLRNARPDLEALQFKSFPAKVHGTGRPDRVCQNPRSRGTASGTAMKVLPAFPVSAIVITRLSVFARTKHAYKRSGREPESTERNGIRGANRVVFPGGHGERTTAEASFLYVFGRHRLGHPLGTEYLFSGRVGTHLLRILSSEFAASVCGLQLARME